MSTTTNSAPKFPRFRVSKHEFSDGRPAAYTLSKAAEDEMPRREHIEVDVYDDLGTALACIEACIENADK